MKKEDRIPVLPMIIRIKPFIKFQKKWMSINILSLICTAAMNLIIAFNINNLTDLALSSEYREIGSLVAFIILLVIGSAALAYLETYSSSHYTAYTVSDIRNHVINHMQRLKVPYVESGKSGDMISRLNNDIELIGAFVRSIPDFIYQVVLTLSTFAYMMHIHWELTVITVLLLVASIVVIKFLNKPVNKYYTKIQEHLGEATAVLTDTIGGICLQKTYNIKEVFYSKYMLALDKWMNWSMKMEKRKSYFASVKSFSFLVPVVVCNLFGAYYSLKGQITPGSFLTYSILLSYIIGSTNSISGMITTVYANTAACSRIFDILDHDTEEASGDCLIKVDSYTSIEFNEVCFSYDGKVDVLKDINMKIPHGKVIALVGASGSGKSTIFKLLCSFYRPQKGSIRIYGSNINGCSPIETRRLMSVVSQDTFLFPVTVLANIEYGKPGASREEVITAARMANAHDFIMQMPEGYDTLIKENGSNLSVGQKQRIAIARAFIRDAPILLLDEPTSALDTQSEAFIQEALKRFAENRTILVIAHRLSTIIGADEIMVLEGGHIIERGSHEELVKRCSRYSELLASQYIKGKYLQEVAADA